MQRRLVLIIAAIIFYAALPSPSQAKYDPSWTWRTHETDHFTLYYPEGHEAFAQRVLSLENEVYTDVTGYLGVTPPHCPIVLNPGTDRFNGFYSPFPNRISLYETPYFSLRGFGPCSDMMDAVFTHEFSHFVHITTRLGWYGKLSPLLGRDSTITNILSPGWIIEGITTNAETLFTDGGRGRCSYFKGEMLSFTEDEGLWNLSAAGTYSPYTPPEGRFYLSGYHMVNYLNRTYGEDAFARLGKYQAMHPLGLTGEALEHVTGIPSSAFYTGFLNDLLKETQKIKAQADSLEIPKGRVVFGEKDEGIIDHFWTDRNTLIALRKGYGKKNALVEIHPETGEILSETETGRLTDLNRITPLGDGENILFAAYFPHILGEGDLGDADLAAFNMKTRETRRLTRKTHIFSASPSHDRKRIVAVRRNGQWNDLVLMDHFQAEPAPIVSKPGYLFEAPRFSPDDKFIVCVVKSGKNSDIALVNPETGAMRLLFPSDDYEDNDPVFSSDGRHILFSSNRSGMWNIFGWDLERKKLFQLTSVNYGATCPRLSVDGKTLAFLALHRGINRVMVAPFKPDKEIQTAVMGNTTIPAAELGRLKPDTVLSPRPMNPGRVYTPFLHIPYVLSDEEETKAGLYILGGDPLGINAYSAFLDYGLSSRHTGYDIRLTNRSFWPDLMFGLYNTANELSFANRNFWIEEQGLELSTGLDMIHKVMPDSIASKLNLGLRYKWLDSLDDTYSYPENSNEITSFFGELAVKRAPDAPARDVLPTWGQDVLAMYEHTLSGLGSETDARNAVVSVTQHLPSLFRHHGLSVKGVMQKQSGDTIRFDKDYSLPRGYSETDTDGDLNKLKNLLVSAEYHFPLVYPDKGFGLSVLHFHLLKSTVFSDFGAGWNGSFSAESWLNKARTVVGGSFRADATLFSMAPVEMGVELGYKLDEKEGFTHLILMIGL